MSPDLIVLGRRLDALESAIRDRAPWPDIEFTYDQVRSQFDKISGTRNRAYDVKEESQ